jgi:FKBP-type peptidyl-prolyl cis-trans isomerase
VRHVTLISILCLAVAVPALRAQREKFTPDDLDYIAQTWPGVLKSNTGIRYIIRRPGKGEPPKPGDVVSILFVGTLLHGKLFEKDLDDKHPFSFRLGRGEVIPGWDEIVEMMRPGSEWLVIIPPELAYGSRGKPPRVPEESSLVFTMQLIGLKPEQ